MPIPESNRTAKGFSLLEILVVLIIMSVSMGLVFGINFRQKESVIIRSFASELSQFLRTARSYALIDGLENICIFNKDDNRIVESLRGKSIRIPGEVELAFDSRFHSGKMDLASFYPNGSVVMEPFAIKSSGHSYLASVEPLLGKVQFKKID